MLDLNSGLVGCCLVCLLVENCCRAKVIVSAGVEVEDNGEVAADPVASLLSSLQLQHHLHVSRVFRGAFCLTRSAEAATHQP